MTFSWPGWIPNRVGARPAAAGAISDGICDVAFRGVDMLAVSLKNRLKRMQYRPDLLNGLVVETGPVFESS